MSAGSFRRGAPPGAPRPRSLQRIISAVEKELLIKVGDYATIEEWTQRGVLLLNTALTHGSADRGGRIHRSAWHHFTKTVLEVLAVQSRETEFLLWGEAAKDWCNEVDLGPLVVRAPHPASRYALADSRSFWGSRRSRGPSRDPTGASRACAGAEWASPGSSREPRLARTTLRSA